MKVAYPFLKFFLDSKLSQKKLVDIFTKIGFECELDGSLIDFDFTPNRGDVLSLKGLRREFFAHQSKKQKDHLSYKKLKFKKDKTVIQELDKTGCGNYHLMIIKDLKLVKKLDANKRNFLITSGIPLIHPLVDLGNYVMLEIGAPMHLFDLDKLKLPINVIFPKEDNLPFRIIGGEIKNIQVSSLTIQDQSGIQAIAGIIGGEGSSVSTKTNNIAVEAAFFFPDKIVNQARKYGIATDASHRFERGVDPKIQNKALERFFFLLNDIATYNSVDCYMAESGVRKTNTVSLDVERFNRFSGLHFSAKKIKNILQNLHFDLVSSNGKSLIFNVPSHRFDVSLEEDLYEELLRCYGYDNIPVNLPKIGPKILDIERNIVPKIREGLVYSGFKELMHTPFVSHETYVSLNSKSWAPAEILNPINENEPFMRGSLFGALFSSINQNIKKGHSSVKVFEIGNVFKKTAGAFAQELQCAGIIHFHEPQKSWDFKEFRYDFFSLKAEVLKLLHTLNIQNINLKASSSSNIFNVNVLEIFEGTKKIGVMGEINISVTQKLIKNPAYGFEFYPDKISDKTKEVRLKLTSKFPQSSRDMNIIISKSYSYAEIEELLLKGKIKNIHSFKLINTFEGKEIPKGFISMTLRFIFQSNVKSLLDSEINHSMNYSFGLLERKMKAKMRS